MQQSISIILALVVTAIVLSILSLGANLAVLDSGDLETAATFYWISLGYIISVAVTGLIFAMVERSTGQQLNYVWASLSIIGVFFVFAKLPDAQKEHRAEFEKYMRERRARSDAGKEDISSGEYARNRRANQDTDEDDAS